MEKEIVIKTENKTPKEIIKEVVDKVKSCSICSEDETGSGLCHSCKNMNHFRLNCRLWAEVIKSIWVVRLPLAYPTNGTKRIGIGPLEKK